MRKIITTLFAIALSLGVYAQNDTMFVHSKQLIHEFATQEVDSIIFYRTQEKMENPSERWEYRFIFHFITQSQNDISSTTNVLNGLGREGWEIVFVNSYLSGTTNSKMFTLRRRLP